MDISTVCNKPITGPDQSQFNKLKTDTKHRIDRIDRYDIIISDDTILSTVDFRPYFSV